MASIIKDLFYVLCNFLLDLDIARMIINAEKKRDKKNEDM